MVLDDVSVTGRRLSRYSTSLRNLFRGQIHYVVGLARPEQPDAWTKRVRDLVYRHGSGSKHTVNFIEFLLLPDWDEVCCPWCAEQAVYRNLILAGTKLPAVLASRNAELAQTNAAPRWSLSPSIGHPSNTSFDVGENSIFAPAGSSPAATYAAVASACQQLRARPDPIHNLAVQLYPQVKCLRYSDYLGTTFTDPVLRSALLRAAHRRELERVSSGGEAKRAEAAKGLLLSPDKGDHCVAIEILLASRLKKLPRLVLTEGEMQAPHLAEINQVLRVLL